MIFLKTEFKGVNLAFLFAVLLFAGAASAQTADESVLYNENDVEEVLTLGTRVAGKSLSESTVPVEIIDEEDILATGHTEVGRIIQTIVSSFNFSSSSISDGTDALRPATLRGLGPDQVLVLVNGKRRHGSALIHINTSVGRGTSGYDMNSIPVAAIKRIEVLRDGASAQYGSDAVAGVINIVLKNSEDDGRAITSYGKTYEGDGGVYVASIGKGVNFGDGSAFFAFEFRDRERTNRAGRQGAVQYPDTEYFELGNSAHTNFDAAANTAAANRGYPEGTVVLTDNAINSNEVGFNRDQFRVGDAESRQYSGALTITQPFGENEVALWGTGSYRKNTSGGFFRRANQLGRNPANSDYPDGFLPLIETSIGDWGGGVEFKRDLNDDGDSVALSVGGGVNTFDFKIKNSQNASYVNCVRNFNSLAGGTAPDPSSGSPGSGQAACMNNGITAQDVNGITPHSADAGGFQLGLVNVNLDFKHPSPIWHFAWGIDYRADTYKINSGDPYSHLDYDGNGGASAGIQVFPGFQPQNEVNETRHAFGFYADFERKFKNFITFNHAFRVERYSDFGTTINGKLAAISNPLWWLTLRGAVSSGFRAPSMQQLYFNSISTQFDSDGIASEVGTFRNDSELAKRIGIPELKEEQSRNFSGGFIINPLPGLSFEADFYWIQVDDRIIISGRIDEDHVDESIIGNNVAQFFLNAADTETRGVDISASYRLGFGASILDFALGGTINETEIKRVNLPAGLPDALLTEQDRSILESWQPKDRWNLSAAYNWNFITATFTQHRYGEYTVLDGSAQTYGAKYPSDAQLSFDFGKFGIFKIGANNIFDLTPDRNNIGQARGETIVDHEGNLVVDSPGVFTYSRRSAPFGFNGGFYYFSWERKI
ncbi:TonB-dependent receptor plug domain-containing protein [Candidatus Mycalebacterium sp.]